MTGYTLGDVLVGLAAGLSLGIAVGASVRTAPRPVTRRPSVAWRLTPKLRLQLWPPDYGALLQLGIFAAALIAFWLSPR